MAIEWLTRAWDPNMYVDKPFLYAMGNTPARDLLKDFQFNSNIDIGLLGAGDLRHVIKTIAGIWTKKEKGRLKQVNFLVNDINVCIIARNVLLLEAILSCDFKNEADLAFIWNIWYNMEISATDYERLKQLIGRVLVALQFAEDTEFEKWKVTKNTRKLLIDLYADWKVRYDEKSATREQRRNYIKERFKLSSAMLVTKFLHQFMSISERASKKLLDELKPILTNEVDAWFKNGSMEMPAGKLPEPSSSYINPLMMIPGSPVWSLHYNSNPYDSYYTEIRDYSKIGKRFSFAQLCFLSFCNTVKAFREVVDSKLVHVSFTFCGEDALSSSTFTAGNTHQYKFDLIHTGNLADHVGLINVLLACVSLLKSAGSLLLTGSMLWINSMDNLPMYIRCNVPIEPRLTATILGLQLAEDLQLGSRQPTNAMPSLNNEEQEFIWVKTPDAVEPLDFEKSGVLTKALCSLTDRCFTRVDDGSHTQLDYSGMDCCSPLTLMHILLNLQHRAAGGMDSLLAIVNKHISSNKANSELTVNWKSILMAYGYHKDNDALLLLKTPLPPPSNILSSANGKRLGLRFGAHLCIMSTNSVMCVDKVVNKVTNFIHNISESRLEFLMPKKWFQSHDVHAALLLCSPFECHPQLLTADNIIKEFRCTPHVLQVPKQDKKAVRVMSCVEEIEGYEVCIVVDEGHRPFTVSVQCEPQGRPTHLLVSVNCNDRSAIEVIDLAFSCVFDESTVKLKVSKKDGTIMCHLAKHSFMNCTRMAASMHFRQLSIKDLQPITNIKKYVESNRAILGAMFSTMKDQMAKMTGRKAGINGFYDFRETIQLMFVQTHTRTPSLSVYKICQTGIDPDSIDSFHTGTLFIIIRGFYILDGLPIIHVFWVDYANLVSLFGRGEYSREQYLRDISRFAQVDCKTTVDNCATIPSLPEERELFRTMLRANSARLTHTPKCTASGAPWCHESFVQTCYSLEREVHGVDGLDTSTGVPKYNPAANTRPTETRNLLDKLSSPDFKPVQAFNLCGVCQTCTKLSFSLSVCGHCNEAKYCNSTCQRQDWPMHRLTCHSASGSILPSDAAIPLLIRDQERDKDLNVSTSAKSTVETSVDDKARPSGSTTSVTSTMATSSVVTSCGACKKQSDSLLSCGRCKLVKYCNRQCQSTHWPLHKLICSPSH